MKNFKRVSYIFLIIIAVILGFTIYSSVARELNSSDIRDKTLSEIKYFESNIVYMFNALNNIEFENYQISVEDISQKSKESSKNASGAGNGDDSSSSSSGGTSEGEGSSSGEESSSSSGGEGGSSGGESSSSSGGESSSNSTSLDQTKKYSLDMRGILNSSDEINWDYIKNEAELIQDSISTMTLDLYEISLNNNDILNFNKEYDNLLVQIKNEDKENTLRELSLLYTYIPKFIKNCSNDEQYEIIIDTKLNVFNAYSFLDSEDWDTIEQYLKVANDKFSKLLTDINIKNKNQNAVNKCYISLNGLQSSVEVKDKQVFLIKYRNFIEDINSL